MAPTGRRAARREAALEFARGLLGADVPASPVDAMEESVRLAAGLIAHYRHELADAAMVRNTGRIDELRPLYTDAIRLEKDVAAAALSAGVAERRSLFADVVMRRLLVLEGTAEDVEPLRHATPTLTG